MALTREFKEIVQARAQRDPAFRNALLVEAMDALFVEGDLEVGKILLRDYINATMGFEELAKATHTSSKSLMRMFGRSGNPRANNLLRVIHQLQTQSHVHLKISAA